MTHIPIMVRIIDEVVPAATMDREISDKVISSCFNCGGIYFYQIVEHIHGTKMATDTVIYCAQCGQMQGGMFNDPAEELDEKMEPKKKAEEVSICNECVRLCKSTGVPMTACYNFSAQTSRSEDNETGINEH